MRLSIIVPAFNEAANIEAALQPLQPMRQRGAEVILVDGGSTDGTRSLAAPRVDCVVDSERGRAMQMNAGARAACGDALLFLHADSLLPEDGDAWIQRALATPGAHWGRFDVEIAGAHFMFPVIAWFMNHRSRLSGIATGDQGIFVTRGAFDEMGGFADQPLMEDVEFCNRMRARSRPVCVHGATITTSGRRWQQHGIWNTILLMWRLRLYYHCGASPHTMHRAYCGK